MKEYKDQPVIPFIAYFTSEFSDPIISDIEYMEDDLPDFINSKTKEIEDLIFRIKEFCLRYDIKPESVFYLFDVGFTAELTLSKILELEKDDNIGFLEDDIQLQSGPVSIQSKPRMQNSKPRMQRSRPRMQVGDITSFFEPYNSQLKTSCGIVLSGGPVENNSSRRIWVLDTGIDGGHPDLKVNTTVSTSFPTTLGNPLVDDNGHGTHCAGIAAAKSTNGNINGMNGVSQGAELISVKILNNCGIGKYSFLLLALEYVIINRIPGDVVMLCLGSYDPDLSFDTDNPISIRIKILSEFRKVFVVMSAGNDYGDANLNFPGSFSFPTRALTVAALDFNCHYITGFAPYSNFGTCAKWAAPGSNIYSTLPDNEYGYMSGTSMSCALTAGIVHARNDLPSYQQYITFHGQDYKIPHL